MAEKEYKAQLNLKINDHMINLRDEGITYEELRKCLGVLEQYESEKKNTTEIVNSMAAEAPQKPAPTAQTDGGQAGNCPVHQKPFKKRDSQYPPGYFWACGTQDNGQWCKEKPANPPVEKEDIPF